MMIATTLTDVGVEEFVATTTTRTLKQDDTTSGTAPSQQHLPETVDLFLRQALSATYQSKRYHVARTNGRRGG